MLKKGWIKSKQNSIVNEWKRIHVSQGYSVTTRSKVLQLIQGQWGRAIIATIRTLLLILIVQTIALSPARANSTSPVSQSPIKSELVHTESGYVIHRNGDPYFIKGAGGSSNMALLAQSGGNSIRTWGTNNAKAILDEAHKSQNVSNTQRWISALFFVQRWLSRPEAFRSSRLGLSNSKRFLTLFNAF